MILKKLWEARNSKECGKINSNSAIDMRGVAPAVSHSRQRLLYVTQQDHACCVKQQTMPAARCSRHCLLPKQKYCLIYDKADTACRAKQQTLSAALYSRQCLLCHTTGIVWCYAASCKPRISMSYADYASKRAYTEAEGGTRRRGREFPSSGGASTQRNHPKVFASNGRRALKGFRTTT